ncbi:MAG: hypothetical protein LAO79_26235 [Acidobacteriia bacterium]|nr:hypothetical protein [Terriglobia bacterium]
MDAKDKCPVPGCGRDVKFIRFECEEVIMPALMPSSELERKPPFGVVGRNFLVECEVHGLKIVQVEGHHITNIPKKSKKQNESSATKTAEDKQRFDAIVHVVHEYANFVSSAGMVLSGCDVEGVPFKPPINTHISHAFFLNCRKLADFFQNKPGPKNDDVRADHYVTGFKTALPVSDHWRDPIDKQLAPITYARDRNAREIDGPACEALYRELRGAWREFRNGLVGGLYEAEFSNRVSKRKGPSADGTPSEFRLCDLD